MVNVWRGCQALSLASAAGSLVDIGRYVTFTIPCQEDKLAAEERRSASSVMIMMLAAARQLSKPWPLSEKKGKGLTDRGDWRLFNDLRHRLSSGKEPCV